MTEQAPANPTATVPAFVQLKNDVRDQIAVKSVEVKQRTVNFLVEKEIERRKDALVAALEQRQQIASALNKVKPDVKTYDAECKILSESYSKAVAETLKKGREALAKVDKAIDKAVNEANYEELGKVKDVKFDPKGLPAEEKPAEDKPTDCAN